MKDFTCKVVYYTTANGFKVKNIQLFTRSEDASQWASIQDVRGFSPVSVMHDTAIDTGMKHLGEVSPQVHNGHYVQDAFYEDTPYVGQRCLIHTFGYVTILEVDKLKRLVYVEFDGDMTERDWFAIDDNIIYDEQVLDYPQII